jgi:2-phosphoglycerate kinase
VLGLIAQIIAEAHSKNPIAARDTIDYLITSTNQIIQSPEIRQVYIAGNSLDPATAKNRFKGRIDIFREIETMALSEHPPVLLLYGGRRTGKTSALKYLPYRLGAVIVLRVSRIS